MSCGEPGGAGYIPARCMMSAPLSPAALTRTRISPLPGSGSGWSSTKISLSRIVTARMGPQSSTSARRARGRSRRRSLGAMTLPDSTYKLEGISPRAFQHPADRAATAALKQVPYLDAVVRRLIELGYERAMRAALLGSAVRLGQDQLPRIWVLEREVFHVLDLEDVPDLYLTQFPEANALTFGSGRPVIVLNSELVRLLDAEGLRVVIAHEAAHVLSDHVLYMTALTILLQLGQSIRLPIFAGLPLLAIRTALLEWSRAAELSCDRAAALGDPRPDGRVPRPHDDLRRRGRRRAQPRRVHEAGARLRREGLRARAPDPAAHAPQHHPPDAGAAHPRGPELGPRPATTTASRTAPTRGAARSRR